jgi:hypothetical protein
MPRQFILVLEDPPEEERYGPMVLSSRSLHPEGSNDLAVEMSKSSISVVLLSF